VPQPARRLPREALRLWRLLDQLPGTEFGAGLAAALLADTSTDAVSAAEDALEALRAAGVVTCVAPVAGQPRFRIGDVAQRQAAAQAAGETEAERHHARLRIGSYYLASVANAARAIAPWRTTPTPHCGGTPVGAVVFHADPADPNELPAARERALGWLTAEHPTLTILIHHPATPPEVAAQLPETLTGYWETDPRLNRTARDAYRQGVRAARGLGDAAPLGRLLTALGQHETPEPALRLLNEARDLYNAAGDDRGLAAALYARGYPLRALGAPEAAEATWRRAIPTAYDAGDPRTAALAHLCLARLAHDQRRYELAAERASTAAHLLHGLTPPDLLHAALARTDWARAAATSNTPPATRLAARQLGHAIHTLDSLGARHHATAARHQRHHLRPSPAER
jgi:tetratricopeptide (TPR) repeat protein